MHRQSKKWSVGLIMCVIVLCAASGCRVSKAEPPELKVESMSKIESGAIDAESLLTEQKIRPTNLFRRSFWIRWTDGIYV